MKIRPMLCLAALVCAPFSLAGQKVSFPEADPVIDLVYPDGWKMETKDEILYAHPEDDAGFFITLAESEAETPEDAAKELKEEVEDLFDNVKYEEPQTAEAGELHLMIINAKGEDEDGKANINICMIAKEGAERFLVLKCVSSQEAFEEHGDLGVDVINSITAHGAEAADLQTYSYPNDENPTFSVDLPADWKVAPDETGAFIESANKQFTATVLAIDTEHIMDAMNSIGQDVTKRFESVVWNEGGKPKTEVDEETGFTITSNLGEAVHADGSRHFLGLFQYAKAGSKKFYVVNTWALEKTLPDNAAAIDAMMASIRHK
jgi:hypothetical protein